MKLLEPYTIRNLKLKNRVVMEPMCMYSCVKHDGVATSFHLAHYVSRATAQVGLIIIEATGITPEGRISDMCLGLYNDEQQAALQEIVEAVHQAGSKIGIQINHAGRKSTAVDGVDVICGPSAFAYDELSRVPHELSEADIKSVVQSFKNAARRADEAGFDLLELHGAHGYLISQFMSPASNKRTDRYKDGSVFLSEVVDAVREVWPEEKTLMLRVSATDYLENSQSVDDTIRMLRVCKDKLDIINVSSGGITPIAPERIYPGYQVDMAISIRTALKLPVIACGLLGDPGLASYLIESDKVDLIGLARPLLSNPHWVLDAAKSRKRTDLITEQYIRAYN